MPKLTAPMSRRSMYLMPREISDCLLASLSEDRWIRPETLAKELGERVERLARETSYNRAYLASSILARFNGPGLTETKLWGRRQLSEAALEQLHSETAELSSASS